MPRFLILTLTGFLALQGCVEHQAQIEPEDVADTDLESPDL